VNRLELFARDVVDWIEDLVGGFSAADWVLLALAGFAIYWTYAWLRSLTRLGPIELEPLEYDGEAGAKVLALTATLRQELSRAGLAPPPAVPAGTPQANLIAAVETSPIPQAAWIGKVLELLPGPPQPQSFKLSGTLRGDEAAVATSDAAAAAGCGISFWLRPLQAGTPLLQTVDGRPDHATAIRRAAALIYVHIAQRAVEAFPLWARWQTVEALEIYLKGHAELDAGEILEGCARLQAAAACSPFNALARLELANLYEQRAEGDATNQKAKLVAAKVRTRALRQYLEVLEEWPGLVEARYRLSVAVAALASACEGLNVNGRKAVHATLQLDGTTPDGLVAELRDLAAREASGVLQVLKPWYVLLREGRLRSQFEPRGHDRRVLKHTAAIAKHGIRLKALPDSAKLHRRVEVWYRGRAVHIGHLVLGLGNLSWNAEYNAACFDAILLARRKRMEDSQ
jgi:hypothetical protein